MMRRFRIVVMIALAAALCAGCGGGSQPPVSASSALLQTRAGSGYKSLYSFGKRPSDGQEPKAALIDLDGTLYGTTVAGGSIACTGGCGTVFTITSSGKEKALYRFTGGTDGANPRASLLAVKGVLYGTTEYGGGEDDFGTVFTISTTGVEKVLHDFGPPPSDGSHPLARLIDVNGKLYGTTPGGGTASECYDNCGTAYSISKSGREKVLHSFALYSDGSNPVANLVNVKGTLYGTTEAGGSEGSYGPGTVFSISTSGTENVLHDFRQSEGAGPEAGLIDVNGTLYGTTGYDGPDDGGTAFSITTGGAFTSLHSFGSGTDGSHPLAPLLNVKGTLYGTTSLGGVYGKGTVFSMNLAGTVEKVVHSFGYGSDGATPLAGLIDVNGTLYGTTSAGGEYGKGTVFALTP